MDIFPKVKTASKEAIEIKLPIEVEINEKLIKEINGLFNTKIFKKGSNHFKFVESKEKGYKIDSKNKLIYFENYKDKVNALFTISQYLFTYNKIPLEIVDAASYEWIGLSMDIARTFFNKEELKRIILIYSSIKYNKIHIHFTDDQAWRLEIKKYPKLVEDGEYLSQSDIKEIVKYAGLLGMDVIPEFDMPGHTRALLSKVKGMSCAGEDLEVWNKFGVCEDVVCISKEETRKVIKNILKEISELFPYKKMHVGGDECPTKAWESCGSCNELRKQRNYEMQDLQKDFMQSIIDYVNNDLNKEAIVWDDIQEFREYNNVTIGFWRKWCLNSNKDYLNNIARKNDLIVSPVNYTYFDWTNNAKDNSKIGMDEGWVTTLEKSYEFNPLEDIKAEYANRVIGSEASLWTERIKDFSRLIYQAFPRSFSLSEVLWGSKVPFKDFEKRLKDNKFVELIAPERYKGE